MMIGPVQGRQGLLPRTHDHGTIELIQRGVTTARFRDIFGGQDEVSRRRSGQNGFCEANERDFHGPVDVKGQVRLPPRHPSRFFQHMP